MYDISIIVPVYNVEKYLHKCLDSILEQEIYNLEIILVDDGSTDLSSQICDEYAKKYNRIKVIHKTNGGLSDARNSGIDIAKGKYIAFIDSDDWITPKMFENLYNLATKYDADIVQGDYIEAYDESIIRNNVSEEIIKYNSEQILEELYSNKYVKTVVVWNKIYKRELFNDIRFPKGKLHEDEFTTYKVLHKANLIIDTNIPVYYYRQRQGSIMNSDFNIKRLDVLEAIEERYKYFKENNLYKLASKTEATYNGYIKTFYIKVSKNDIKDKKLILKNLEEKMKINYIRFLKNRDITFKGKITSTLLILNQKLFCKIYSKVII